MHQYYYAPTRLAKVYCSLSVLIFIYFYQLKIFLLIIHLCGYVHIHPSAPESRRGPQIAWRCEMPNMDAGN